MDNLAGFVLTIIDHNEHEPKCLATAFAIAADQLPAGCIILQFPNSVAKCRFLTGCDHGRIKFKFDRSIGGIFHVGWLMMHINIVIMQKHQAMTCSTLYSINNTQNLAPKLHTGIFPAMNRKRVLTNIYLNEGVLYHVCGCAMMPCKEGCCSA